MNGKQGMRGILSRQGRPASSLSTRFVALMILGEIAFGLVVGVTVGVYSARLAARERQASLERSAVTVGAALIPLIADERRMCGDEQMRSILDSVQYGDVRRISIVDDTGEVVASSSPGLQALANPTGFDDSAFAMLTKPQIIRQPILVEGFQFGEVVMEFDPPGFATVMSAHVVAAMIVILSVALVSAPWSAWLVLRTVVEPVGDLRDGARMLAAGRRDLSLCSERHDEIGELGCALDELSAQLAERERSLEESYVKLKEAFDVQVKAREELEQLARMKSDFVAVASHELRTPLSVVRMYAEMLEDGELGDLEEDTSEAIEAITSATARLTTIVSDLMDAALLERGLMNLEFADVELDEIVRSAVRDENVLARASGVRIVIDGELPEVSIRADRLRLRQVLDNLLSNAVKYSGGANEVRVCVQHDGQDAEVLVIDRGQGVPADKHSEVFGLFGRLDSKDNRDTAGLGLGLAISARIAEAHGGSISYADNPEGEGSVFKLTLPLEASREGVRRKEQVRVV